MARPKDPDHTEATRAQLRRGAITAFGERGFHGATIKDIATEDPDLEDVFLAMTYGDASRPSPTQD